MSGPGVAAAAQPDAWSAYLRGLEALGRRVLRDDFPSDPAGRDDCFRHLGQQVLCWLEWSIGYGDPAAPAFQRQNDAITPWGGPNADNVYRHARVAPGHRYRIRGRTNSCEDFALAVRAGFRHTATPATLKELTASDVGIGRDQSFELVLGGAGREPNHVPLPDGAVMCSIREYYFDWSPSEPATFTIEHVGGPAAGQPELPGGLAEALDLTERSLVFWNDYMRDARARQEDNSFGNKIDVPRGLQLSQFGFCFYDLGPDEALVVECDVPDARYWSFQLYGMHFFRPFDLGRTTSLNHRQAHVAADGSVHLVAAHSDPGVVNWLDTTGRALGLVNYRHFWGSRMPELRTRVVPLADVRAALPPHTPAVSASARSREVAARRAHLAWRFRT
ncbi:MAG: DUF1214 domain-containing protein [Actinobacteria bacterium]|nr:DUF1214 domain-containing protein [Actinomycetota bacterium]